MITNYEIIQKAKNKYEELGGLKDETARLLRSLWERLETADEKVRQFSNEFKKS
jgi:hypothetical protein